MNQQDYSAFIDESARLQSAAKIPSIRYIPQRIHDGRDDAIED